MKNKILFLILFSFFASYAVLSQESANALLTNLLKPLNSTLSTFVDDYSVITGLYSANPDVKGAASIGSFPSFRFGTHFGAIFMTNPIRFLKSIDIGGMNYDKLTNMDSFKGAKDVIGFFDKNFLPIPVTSYSLEIGLPKGFSVGSNFQVIPIGDFVNGIVPEAKTYLNGLTFWGVGANFNYTIMKEYKWFPSLSVGSGFNYNSTNIDIKAPIGSITLDASADVKADASINFSSKSDISTFYFDFTISKNFIFFQPFINLKFTQTIHHNVTKLELDLNMSNATQEIKDIFGSGKIGVNNLTDKNANLGLITPVTDFVVSTGFEFVMGVYRMGVAGSYGLVSQKGMVTLNIRFQVEKENFKKSEKK